MATTKERIVGHDITLTATGAGTTTAWESLEMDVEYKEADATAASSLYEQFAFTVKKCSGTITGFSGASGIPPAVGDTITALDAQEGSNALLSDNVDSATAFGVLKVTSVNYKAGVDPMKWSFKFRSGALN